MSVRPAAIEANVTAGSRDQAPGAIDLQHLSRYTLGDRGLEKEILLLFLTQLPETIAALSTATSECDWKVAAHTLKGSGRAVGAWRIAGLAEDAEGLLFGINREARLDAVARIEEAVLEARAFIDAVYGPA
jgi:HPt (histidine-containing phosphotransfer) domain-containing protein